MAWTFAAVDTARPPCRPLSKYGLPAFESPLSIPCRSSPGLAGRKQTGSYGAEDWEKRTFAAARLSALSTDSVEEGAFGFAVAGGLLRMGRRRCGSVEAVEAVSVMVGISLASLRRFWAAARWNSS